MPGVDLFLEQLKTIGINATIVDKSWVVFDYLVEGGTFAAKQVRIAINIPSDFPVNPPTGINFTPRLRPINTNSGSMHPEKSHPCVFPAWSGNGEYWSRPFGSWNNERKKTAQTYMSFVRQLWETT